MHRRSLLSVAVVAVVAGALAGCADTGSSAIDTVPASFALSQASTSALGAAILGVSPGDDSVHFGGGRIRRSAIDSLIVTVTRVDVLPDSEIHRCHPPVGDSISGFHPGEHPMGEGEHPEGPMGPRPGGCGGPHPEFEGGHPDRPDSLEPPETGWGSRQRHWYSLDVVGSGHLNLLALPIDTASGLVLASGTLPVGEYGAARLILSSAKIYFDTTISTAAGFTFLPNVAYDVTLPSRDSTKGIMTKAGFTLSAGGANVVLTFDPGATLRGAVVTGTGEIIIRPTLTPHRGRHD